MNARRARAVGQAITGISVAIIAYVTLAPDITSPGSDQLGHFLLFLPLGAGAALWMAVLPIESQRKARAIALMVILVFAAATEIGQRFVEGRDPSLGDFFADAAGAGLGVIAGGFLASRTRRQ